MENRKIRCKFWKSCIVSVIITILIPGLSGCQIIEPEKRAYPLVVGIDSQYRTGKRRGRRSERG